MPDSSSRPRRPQAWWPWAALLAPTLFLVGALSMSYAERAFMDRLGWDVWPSGLALGPQGWGQILVFLLFAACYLVLAVGLLRHATWSRPVRIVRWVLLVGALGCLLLPFRTDRPHAPATWHGALHAVGYVTLMTTLVPSVLVLLVSLARRVPARCWRPALADMVLLGLAWAAPNASVRASFLFFAVPFGLLAALAGPLAAQGRVRLSGA